MSAGSRLAIYPGSFDPITYGHEDLVRRVLGFADRVIVAVAYTATMRKQGLFTVPERVEMIRETFAGEPRVEVDEFNGLLVDYARSRGSRILVRGLRAVADFEYEFQMALMNRELWPDVETLFLAPDARYSFLSASLVREIASLGGDTNWLTSPLVRDRLESALARERE